MKIVPRSMLTALFCAVIVARLNAEPVSPQADPTVNPHALEDPDGVPLQVTHPELFQPSQNELDKKHQAEEKAKADQNWLMRGYEQKMRESTLDNPSSTFINQISSSKELSDMAGLPYLASPDDTKAALKTGTPAADKTGLRTDAALNDPVSRASSLLSKPFFSSASPLPGLSDTLPPSLLGASKAPVPVSLTPPPRRPALVTPPPADSDSMALSSPGLVAAENQRAGDGFSSTLSLDLPDDTNVQNDDRVTTIPPLALPLKTNQERLQRQNAAMGLATNKATTTTIVKPVAPAPYVPDIETVPISRPSFGRSALADPHDNMILH